MEYSDNERNFVLFQCRAYVEAVKPDALKGVSWKTITDKVKEIKPQAAPVVEGSGAATNASADAAATPPPASAPPGAPAGTSATATPIISSQGEFNAWFQNQMGKSVGSLKLQEHNTRIRRIYRIHHHLSSHIPLYSLRLIFLNSVAVCVCQSLSFLYSY